MKVGALVGRLCAAAESAEPLRAVTEALRDLAGEREGILDSLSFMSGIGSDPEQSFYRAADLSLLKVRFAPGRRTPPHDHGTWAAILLLSGREQNVLYRRGCDGSLTYASERVLEPGDVLPMTLDAAHVVACVGTTPAIGLHVYGGDLPAIPRHVWHPRTLEQHPHEDARYAQFAAIASEG